VLQISTKFTAHFLRYKRWNVWYRGI